MTARYLRPRPVPLPREAPDRIADSQPEPAELATVLAEAARYYRVHLTGSWVPGYLSARGFGRDLQHRWQAGYSPNGWDRLTWHLRAAGYPDRLIQAAGLARLSRHRTLIDTFRDRAMLPIRSPEGVIIAFIGRAPDHADPDIPKYLNSPGTALYHKAQSLFGLCEARAELARGATPVLVEGPLDAIAVTAAGQGRFAGVAPCGAVFSERLAAMLSQLADLAAVGALVAFDADGAGQRAAISAYQQLAPFTGKTSALILPIGQDPAQVLRESGPAALAAMLATRTRPLADLVIDAETSRWTRWLDHAEGQIGAMRGAAPIIAALPPDQVARQVARVAARIDLRHAMVTEAVTDALSAF